MSAGARTSGIVSTAIGIVLFAWVAFNFAMASYNRLEDECIGRAYPSEEVNLVDVGEGVEVQTSYSLIPVGLNCDYAVEGEEDDLRVFLDLGTAQTILGAILATVGLAFLSTNHRVDPIRGGDEVQV